MHVGQSQEQGTYSASLTRFCMSDNSARPLLYMVILGLHFLPVVAGAGGLDKCRDLGWLPALLYSLDLIRGGFRGYGTLLVLDT